MATLSGAVPVVAVTSGIPVFNYGTLSVDAIGKGLANANPLRFMLDSTRLKNGPHNLQVSVSDDAGLLAVSPAVPVIIDECGPRGTPVPVANKPCPGDARDRTLCPGRAGRRDRSDGADAPRGSPAGEAHFTATHATRLPAAPARQPRCHHPAGACRGTRGALRGAAHRRADCARPAIHHGAALVQCGRQRGDHGSHHHPARRATADFRLCAHRGQRARDDLPAPLDHRGRRQFGLEWRGQASHGDARSTQCDLYRRGSDIALVDGQQKTLDRKVFELHGHSPSRPRPGAISSLATSATTKNIAACGCAAMNRWCAPGLAK